jgi:hypothetical protein
VAERRIERVARFLDGDADALPTGAPIAKVALGLLRDALAGDARARAKLLDLYVGSDHHDRVELPGLADGALHDRAAAVLSAVAAGAIPVGAGKDAIASIAAAAVVGREQELIARVEELERKSSERVLPATSEPLA